MIVLVSLVMVGLAECYPLWFLSSLVNLSMICWASLLVSVARSKPVLSFTSAISSSSVLQHL